jgi:hypothetical protein
MTRALQRKPNKAANNYTFQMSKCSKGHAASLVLKVGGHLCIGKGCYTEPVDFMFWWSHIRKNDKYFTMKSNAKSNFGYVHHGPKCELPVNCCCSTPPQSIFVSGPFGRLPCFETRVSSSTRDLITIGHFSVFSKTSFICVADLQFGI